MSTPEAAGRTDGSGDWLQGLDVTRYHAGLCQHCDRPCAVRCGCGEVVERDAARCPACGYYDLASAGEDDETGRVLMCVCPAHATA